ncbi:hypothetical protein DEFDS_0709 [Deferribacter desulfuricans SSM1]|uniref:Helix-turn-helix domain-containing protein n=1 Tax=Deferribacter desulfuricans (strain DSM 14783 / JCM 11476 / NBRC 101012 / SSM1) TaxID=639282 RepID=D3PC66_DEFDS|nr:helix-turn-helix domain-containing protein [Deferribacter desulfuricans]BAI80189.1 hypothetical protein DEFDS_0709 [Deferribacter desulfuricans SSM1]
MKKEVYFLGNLAKIGGGELFDNQIRQSDEELLSTNRIFAMVTTPDGFQYIEVTNIVRKLLKENEELKERFKGDFTLLTTKEMAKELRCTEQHLRNLISKKKLKMNYHYGKLGSKVLFIKERMYEFANLRVLDCGRKKPEVV